MDLTKMVSLVGRGGLAGLGIGASLYGILFLYMAFKQGNGLNIAALVAVLAGCTCIAIAATMNKHR